MVQALGRIAFYLAKEEHTFDSVLAENFPKESEFFKVRSFQVSEIEAKFYCIQSSSNKPNPLWLDFVNEQLASDEKINFETFIKRPSGLLLIGIHGRVFAATFGVKGAGLIDKSKFVADFGIKTAMNMCGNTEIRQAKSRTHAINTENIDRQFSQPSELFAFDLSNSEILKYISAHLETNNNITLQGKDNLTIKMIGQEKLSWQFLSSYAEKFLEAYGNDKYKLYFPNYADFQDVSKETAAELDIILISKISSLNFSLMHMAIPEFIEDDKFSFSYTKFNKRENQIFSHLLTDHFSNDMLFDLDTLDIATLKSMHVYAFSHEEDSILEYKKWSVYSCIVAEVEVDEEYFILSEGSWRKIDDEFFKNINNFIDNVLTETEISEKYKNHNIADVEKKQNREGIFNQYYCETSHNAILFDQAKLQVGQSKKDKEFCDILEILPNGKLNIVHVKKYGGSSAINYLFSQAKFYCESFLCDTRFLLDIRDFIVQSGHERKNDFLMHIKETLPEVSGDDYEVGLWILYNNAKEVPKKADLPLMAKYEIKLTYERLRNMYKFSSVSISWIPVVTVNFRTAKKNPRV